jgi:hypothetical protein
MRKFFTAAAGVLLTSLFFTSPSFSQDLAYHHPLPKSAMAGFLVHESGVEKTMKVVSVDANLKLQKSFNRQFKDAGQVTWYSLGKKYLAQFNYHDRKTTALFTKNGYNIYSFAQSGEKDLPKNYRRMIKSMYVDFDILNAIEINTAELKHPVWLVNIQSEDNIVIARITDGGLDEYARYDTKLKEVKKQRKGRVIIHKN